MQCSFFVINGVKVDCVKYGYPWLAAEHSEMGIRLASIPDIAAMKINANNQSGKS